MGKINLQLYSFLDGRHNDFRENMRLAKEMGYDGVELFGPAFEIPAEEMKALADSLGLEIVSMHAPRKDLILPLAAYAKTVGSRYVGLGMETMVSDEEVHRWAREMNTLGRSLHEQGLMMIYHNHTQEFLPCEGRRVIDVLMDETDPALVGFELDAGWCAAAGYDPVEFVNACAGRIRLIHVKESGEVIGPLPPMDFSKAEWRDGRPVFSPELQAMLDHAKEINCPACEGLVDWAKLKAAADAQGCEAYIVEREYSKGDRIEELKNDIRRYREVL